MRGITTLLRPTGIITLAVAGLLTLDVAWIFARQGNLAASKNHRWDYVALAKAPEKARVKRNPLESDREAVAAGGKLFQQHCAECHGSAAEGGRRGPSLRATELQRATPGAFFWILSNGVVRRGMPDWSKLPPPERWQIVTFLKSLGPAQKVRQEGGVIRHGHPKTGGCNGKEGPSW
jgi:mono/diheme cytochrome c family protein